MNALLPTHPQLKRGLRTAQFYTLGFGCIVGVGWVVVLGEWLRQAGPLGAMLAFALGGIAIAIIGLCYAEIATMFPASGGEVAYALEIYGLKTCFAVSWLLALTWIVTTAFEAISLGWVASTLIRGIQGPVLYRAAGAPVQAGDLVLGLAGMALLTLLNYRGIKRAALFQDMMTHGLLALSLVFVAAGIGWGSVENLRPLFHGDGSSWRGFAAVLITAPFWYGGFNVIPQVMGEKADSASLKSVGRTIVLSILTASVFYCLVILSASMATPWKQLLDSELPAASAFESAFNSPLLGKVVLLAAMLGLVTTWNAVFIAGTRVIYTLGRGQIIASALGKVHPVFGSPSNAVIFVGIVAGSGVLVGRSFIIPIVNIVATCASLVFLATCYGVIRLKRKRPELPRPYQMPGGYAPAAAGVLIAAGMFALSLYEPYRRSDRGIPVEWLVFLAWIGLGFLSWSLTVRNRQKLTHADRRRLILSSASNLK
jgi:amino acid transporter